MAPVALLVLTAHAAEVFDGRQYWIGDPHAHSGVSEDASDADQGCTVCGSLADFYTTARANGLDWVAPIDHVNGQPAGDGAAWAEHLAAGLAADASDPLLTVVPAAELWLTTPSDTKYGHLSLFLFGSDADLAAIDIADVEPTGDVGTEMETCASIWSWVDQLGERVGPAMAIPHHPALVAPSGWDWTCLDQPLAPIVEVYSEHGNSMGDGLGWDPPWSGEYEAGTVHEALDPEGYGWKLGFIGGTDEHDTLPGSVCDPDRWISNHPYGGGLAIVVTDPALELSRGMIHDAFAARHTIATSGPMLPVSMRFGSTFGELGGLGDDLAVPAGADLDVHLAIPPGRAPTVVSVELVGPLSRLPMVDEGGGVWTLTIPAGQAEAWYYAAIQIDGAIWWETPCDDGGADDMEWVWTSPAYLSQAPLTEGYPDPEEQAEDTSVDTGAGPDTGSPVDTGTMDPTGQVADTDVVVLAPEVGCGLGLGVSAPGALLALGLIRRRRR